MLVPQRNAAARVAGRHAGPGNFRHVLAVRVADASFPRAAAPDVDAARRGRDGAVRVGQGAGAGAHAFQSVQ